MPAPRPTFYRRLTASVPLLVTVVVHVVLIAIAGYFFVTEQLVGKKRTFEAASSSEPTVAQKQVEHRLQVARKGGGSSSSSPISASRIFSNASDALQMPAMPELPSVGASSLSGMGFGAGMGAVGTGTGYSTGLGASAGLGGRGFMSMSFLGVTNQRASKVVFVVDIGPALMDIRKGGFRAFEILRHEIARLIGTLPPATEFDVVLFENTDIRLFASELKPATAANKTEFFKWLEPINANLTSLGARSIPASSPRWSFKRPESLKLDPSYHPPYWVQGVHAALDKKPDTIFIITGSAAVGQIRDIDEVVARKTREREQQVADLKRELTRQGLNPEAIVAARGKALAKLRAELDAINRQLVAQKKDPFVVTDTHRILAPDFQAALSRAGVSLKIDTAGWTDKAGTPIWTDFSAHVNTTTEAEFTDLTAHISKLQYGLVPSRASLNIFLFVGPEEKSENAGKNLSAVASRNGGKFNLLTTKRLEEITSQAK